jgi:hypothetical protein
MKANRLGQLLAVFLCMGLAAPGTQRVEHDNSIK